MARGLAHIGVLRTLEQARVPIDMIAGVGMGAVCGGLYAAGVPLEQLERLARDGELNPLVERSWRQRLDTSSTPYHNRPACEAIARLLGTLDFEALETPFFSVAADLVSGQTVVMDEGRLAEALAVALSPPGLTPAFSLGGRLLADGTPLNPLPTDLIERRGADLILASSVVPGQEVRSRRGARPPEKLNLARSLLSLYDALAQPAYLDRVDLAGQLLTLPVAEFPDTAFDRAGEIILRGQEAARRQVQQIHQWMAE